MKKLLLLLLCAALGLSLCGCYDSTDITERAFILAVGIDTGEEHLNRYTFQLVKPSAFESEGGGDDSGYVNMSIDAPDVYTAMDLMNSAMAKEYDYAHIKLVVFSKAVAEQGIQEHLTAMIRSSDFHPNTRVAVAEGEAAAYLEDMQPPLESNPAAYYDHIFDARYTAYAPDVMLKDFDGRSTCNAVPLVGVSNEEEEPAAEYSGGAHPQPQMKAGEAFKESEYAGDIMGMAILKDGRMVADAGAEEAFLYHLLTQGQVEGHYTLELEDGHRIVAGIVKRRRGGGMQYTLTDDGPVIDIEVQLEGSVVWSDYQEGTVLEQEAFQDMAEACMTQELTAFLDKCSREYKADILHLSDEAKKRYWTIQDWEASDWMHTFETLRYEVHTDLTLRREGMNIQ